MGKDQIGLRRAMMGLLFLLTVDLAEAHPAHAKPVNYPFVVGFERFHSGMDDDDYLAEGGFILLNELNCVACHAPPTPLADQLEGTTATHLGGVGSRLDPINLEMMIRNPRFLKRDSIMPSLFAGPDRDLEEVKAIKQYLASLTEAIPTYPVGDIEVGRSLYHRIGCVACHAPELGYRPIGLPENAAIELTGLPSVPMNLADIYDLNSLTHFLLHPNEHRPSGRMPEFPLTQEEAVDLAAYLKAGPDLLLPANLTKALSVEDNLPRDDSLREKGKELFVSKNCSACHTLPGQGEGRTRHLALPLLSLKTDGRLGCFSDRPLGGLIPFYGLDEVQKRAITAALVRLAERKHPDLAAETDWRMKILNCYACHERGGVGGAETSREVYFGFAVEKAQLLGRWGNLPPALDHVGAKLTSDWMARVLYGSDGGGSVRSYSEGRMPTYRRETVTPLATAFAKLDQWESSTGTVLEGTFHQGSIEKGEAFFGASCVQCHRAGPTDSSDLPGIDLATSPLRLQKRYFEQIIRDPQSLQPDSLMVSPFAEGEKGDSVGGLWQWLKSLSTR